MCGSGLFVEQGQLFFQDGADTVLGEINLGHSYAEMAGDLGGVPFPQNIIVEDLVLLG